MRQAREIRLGAVSLEPRHSVVFAVICSHGVPRPHGGVLWEVVVGEEEDGGLCTQGGGVGDVLRVRNVVHPHRHPRYQVLQPETNGSELFVCWVGLGVG